jgi:HIRAN domain
MPIDKGDKHTAKRRLSITKLQRETEAAIELISLCQTVTEDGSVSDEEVAALRQWLTDNADTELPARDFLEETVARIVADGVVTVEERRDLWRAIETVLPRDLRAPLTARRRAQEYAVKSAAREAREQARADTRVARERNRPVGSWNFMVAGCRHEDRPATIREYAEPDASVDLVREPGNKYSRNAVGVCLDNALKIGYVPEELATEIAPLLDGGHRQSAYLTKILSGGRTPIPVVQAYLYRPDAEVPVRLSRFGLDPPPASAAVTDGSAVPTAQGRSATVAGPSASLPVITSPPPRRTTKYVLLACALIIVALLARLLSG